jgi:hypothetical protein
MHKRIALAIGAVVVTGVGILYAQPGNPPKPEDNGPGSGKDIADVTVEGSKEAQLPPREMATQADKMIAEMEGFHKEILEDQSQAKTSKDVIKLNCVNENLLALKQLLNIADAAENELDEAIAGGIREDQIHNYGKITIARDNARQAATESQNCIGEDLHFIGKNDVQVTGPVIKYDPTDDGDLGQADGEDPFDTNIPLEDPAFASPFAPE